jgi:hypothetical protein
VSVLLGAYLTGAVVGLIVGALIAVSVLGRVIDRAVTLPDPRRPHADDDTARIEPTNIRDLPRSRQSFEEYA